MTNLFSPLKIGAIDLKHRIVMAPLTRMRANKSNNAAHDINAEYYGQRATDGGLIIAEASQVMAEGQGYPTTPGKRSLPDFGVLRSDSALIPNGFPACQTAGVLIRWGHEVEGAA